VRSYLTQEGRRITRLCMNRSFKAEDESLARLEAEERSTLVNILRRLVKHGPAAAGDGNGLTN
jgi:DNA-binding MarR family transcriptional regulator